MQMRKSLFTSLALLFALSPVLPVMAQKEKLPALNDIRDRYYMAYPVTTSPKIDGKLEKEFWDKLPKAKYFVVTNKQTNSVTRQTMFQMAYDAKFLYIGATMFEPFPHLLKDGKDVPGHLRDRINFIFSKVYKRDGAYDDSPYFFLLYNVGGTYRVLRNDVKFKRTDNVPVTKEWLLAYGKDKCHWYMEAKIPFSSLGFSPKDERVFFNVRRDQTFGPIGERQSMWSQQVTPRLAAHSFGTLIFNKKRGPVRHHNYWLNAKPRFWYQYGILQPIGNKKGSYAANYLQYGKEANWKNVEKAANKISHFFKVTKGIDNLISDKVDEYYMEYLQALAQVKKSAPPRALQTTLKNAVITSLTLNGVKIAPKNGKYLLPIESGISKLEVKVQAKGAAPGVKFALAGSPETAQDFRALDAKGKIVPLKVVNGYLWAGAEKSLTFQQNLVWNREYCNHGYSFIHPNVKRWGVSPGETMQIIHKVRDVNKSGKKASYTLIMEVPEGFKRINDWSGSSFFLHFPTRNVKEEKVLINGEKYIRYTHKWTLPAKLERGLSHYIHYISVQHVNYKFAKGKKPFLRFRRVIDGYTTDIVNTIPLYGLPPIKGGKMKKVIFPQYHNFGSGRVSYEQWDAMVKNSISAGLDSLFYQTGTPISKDPKTKKLIGILQQAPRNYIWSTRNLPLWGAGPQGGAVRKLVEGTRDLQAVHFDEKGGFIPAHFRDFCWTKAVKKYRKAFMEALVKDYKWMMALTNCKNIFINDENKPKRIPSSNSWTYSLCFCKECKSAFFKYSKIPPRAITNKEIVEKYEKEWVRFWSYAHKNLLLSLVYEAVKKAGGRLAYYHDSSDKDSVIFAKGLYDQLFVTTPGCATFTGSQFQPNLDSGVKWIRANTGIKHMIGQFQTYTTGSFHSSDGVYFYPEETKLQLLRLAASLHGGAICESADLYSAGALYYAGEATRIIAEYEELFYNGERKDTLAGGSFAYPDKLVLVKGKERLVLLFNESEKAKKGTLTNLSLHKGAKAKIVGKKNWISNPGKMAITIPAKDAVLIYIK